MMLVLLALGAFAALAGAFLAGRAMGQANLRDVRTRVLPYLRRKASEARIEVRPENPRAPESDSVREAAALAEQLVDAERRDVALGATMEIPRPPK